MNKTLKWEQKLDFEGLLELGPKQNEDRPELLNQILSERNILWSCVGKQDNRGDQHTSPYSKENIYLQDLSDPYQPP